MPNGFWAGVFFGLSTLGFVAILYLTFQQQAIEEVCVLRSCPEGLRPYYAKHGGCFCATPTLETR